MEITQKEIFLLKDYLEELVSLYENTDDSISISGEDYCKLEVWNLLQKIS